MLNLAVALTNVTSSSILCSTEPAENTVYGNHCSVFLKQIHTKGRSHVFIRCNRWVSQCGDLFVCVTFLIKMRYGK